MSRFLHRLGRGAAPTPGGRSAPGSSPPASCSASPALRRHPRDDYDVPGARAQRGIDQLRAHLPGAGNATAQVVVHDDDGRRPTDPSSAR